MTASRAALPPALPGALLRRARGLRVLIVDTDPQGSITLALRRTNRVEHDLHDFIVRQLNFDLCKLRVAERIDVLPSNKATPKVDAILGLNPSQLFSFRGTFAPVGRTCGRSPLLPVMCLQHVQEPHPVPGGQIRAGHRQRPASLAYKESLNRLFRKLQIKNRTELAMWAVRNLQTAA